MALSDSLQNKIASLLLTDRVVLFMKGNRRAPQCGFSAQVVQILDSMLPDYSTVDVLASPEIRDAIKQYSNWPTIPQLYVDSNFIGGCDIVREMSSTGELQKLFGVRESSPQVPTITVSESATKAFETAVTDAAGDSLRLQVTPEFEHDLYFGPRAAGDIEVRTNGPVFLLDKGSATRADGIHIDFVTGPNGGFKIKNPNEPVRAKPLSPQELKSLLDRQEIVLFDVRPEDERKIASIPAARPLDADGQEYLFALDPNAPIALHCHHGIRSDSAAQQLIRHGFRNVYNLSGGIDAWSQAVDPAVPRY